MKTKLIFFALAVIFFLPACENNPVPPAYRPVFPALPEHWMEILGEPHWRLEWVGDGAVWKTADVYSGQAAPKIPLVNEWSSPILAWPYWPERGLLPGMMRPAGALFPWDALGQKVDLSWKAGAEAVFWKELARAERPPQPPSASAARRLPWYFDWPRFRELLESENISEPVRKDLWLADWGDIAQRTVNSGFDRRRITSRRYTERIIPEMGNRWISSSPFAPPLEFPPGSGLSINVTEVTDIWVSSDGILKASVSGWILLKN